VQIGSGPDPSVIRISGEIDLSNLSELEAALEEAISQRDHVALHVWDVDFMGLEGARAVIRAAERLPQDGRLYVLGPRAGIMQVMAVLDASRVRQLVLLPEC
jgi:anti-anti-sigma factor